MTNDVFAVRGTLAAAIDHTAPSYASQHPATRAVQHVLAAHRIAVTPCAGGDACRRIAELLADVPADIAALQQYIEAQDADMRGLRDQGLSDAREITRLTEANRGLNEQLYALNTEQHETERTERFA